MSSYDIHIALAMELLEEKKLNMTDWVYNLTLGPASILNLDLQGFRVGEVAGLNLISQGQWIANTHHCYSYGDNIPRFNHSLSGRVIHRISGWQASPNSTGF